MNKLENIANKLLSGKKKKQKKFQRKKTNKSQRLIKVIKSDVGYHKYMKLDLWKKRRAKYYRTHKKQCCICKARYGVGLHHLTYKNLGDEKDEDLVALCWKCHQEYHKYFEHNDKEGFKEFVKDMKWYYKNKDENL